MLRLALTPRWLAYLGLVLVLVAAFITLSTWQVSRAEHKNDAVQSADTQTVKDFNDVMAAQVPMPGYLSHQRVSVTGHFLAEQQVVVSGRSQGGHSGYWVVTMFAPDGARLGEAAELDAGAKPIAIPVVRGFTQDRQAAHDSRAAAGTVSLTATVGPTSTPQPSQGQPAGEVKSLSTAQLVNLFGVYTYSGVLYPDAQPEASIAAAGFEHVALAAAQSGGVDLQSAAYAVEWLIFAGFALYIWWRLLRDEYLSQLAAAGAAAPAPGYVVVKRSGERNLRMDPGGTAASGSPAPPGSDPAPPDEPPSDEDTRSER
ncbi:SURF1 family protein [Brevibacterium sp. BRM-1]|uniref:SURF1 family protein n=1 Tax=Brevibacterium sp. BRM-1 TaxID=2999062 RepID=UPI0022831496|nr:SURF1 family protein [Brevibacterium sp. BRM-1]WAL40145.1 SURF1 family protein [Brevibacterium sp. BRM-1]